MTFVGSLDLLLQFAHFEILILLAHSACFILLDCLLASLVDESIQLSRLGDGHLVLFDLQLVWIEDELIMFVCHKDSIMLQLAGHLVCGSQREEMSNTSVIMSLRSQVQELHRVLEEWTLV